MNGFDFLTANAIASITFSLSMIALFLGLFVFGFLDKRAKKKTH